jgi:hypothetical protein
MNASYKALVLSQHMFLYISTKRTKDNQEIAELRYIASIS